MGDDVRDAAAAVSATWELEEVPCDFCGSSQADTVCSSPDRQHGLPGEFHVVRCRECGLCRTNPRPTAESLAAAYPDDYAPHQADKIRPHLPTGLFRWALVTRRGYPLGRRGPAWLRALAWPWTSAALGHRRANGYLPYQGEGRLLDFGCGAGGYVAKMSAAGWRAEGMDLSADAVALGRQAGLTMHQGTLPGADLPGESYDVLTMWQVIEHVPSPRATLAAARSLLKPGGTLLVACPQLDSMQAERFRSHWFALELPRHLTHFSRATLGRHLEAEGFRVRRMLAFRRPGIARKSYRYLAADTGRWVWRWLARSRLIPSLQSYWALLRGKTAQMVCLAEKV